MIVLLLCMQRICYFASLYYLPPSYKSASYTPGLQRFAYFANDPQLGLILGSFMSSE